MYNILLQEDEDKYVITDEDFADYEVQQYTLPEGELRDEAVWITLKYDGSPVITPDGSRRMSFRVRNNTYARWDMRFSITCPDNFIATGGGYASLEHGEEAVYEATVSAGADFRRSQADFVLNVDRLNEEGIWKRYYIPFVLVRTSHWVIDGEHTDVDGNVITFAANGTGKHVAETVLYSAERRPSRFNIATTEKMKLFVDGRQVLDGGVNPTLRNSYSTLNFPDQETEFLLEAGEHSLRVELDGDAGKELVFSFVFTAKKCTTPEGGRPLVAYEFLENVVG